MAQARLGVGTQRQHAVAEREWQRAQRPVGERCVDHFSASCDDMTVGIPGVHGRSLQWTNGVRRRRSAAMQPRSQLRAAPRRHQLPADGTVLLGCARMSHDRLPRVSPATNSHQIVTTFMMAVTGSPTG